MSVFLIPFQNVPQQFEMTMNGVDYLFTTKWNDQLDGGWFLDIQLAADQSPIAYSIPLIVGADLLEGLEYLNLGVQLIVYTTGDDFAVPTLDNLGDQSNVYFQTTDST